jgi:Animal haem peroxidase
MREQRARQRQRALSRRQFLKALGGGVAALGVAHAAPPADSTRPGRFGVMFQRPPFAPPTDEVREALLALGAPGGILDAKDELTAGPVALIVDPALSVHNPNSPTHTAGTTFMGQFLDHDITFDTTSRLGQPTSPVTATNARTPAFDLDSVYGDGPLGAPQLYDPGDQVKFRVESGGLFEDLPRYPGHHAAIIADPRNDENLILAGLHVAVLKFHNNAVDLVQQQGGGGDVFARARQLTSWHYQWLILNEFLPQFVGQAMIDDILARGRRFYTPTKDPFIPVEFSGAAYRFGHSMVRPSYRANLQGDNGQPFFGLIFDPAEILKNPQDPADLSGGARALRRFVGWQTFFKFDGPAGGEVKPNKRIDTNLSTPLFSLPPGAIAGSPTPAVLPQRTLLRHITWKLPSGQKVAEHMGVRALKGTDLQELRPLNLERNTPLWYYILKEAQVMEDGLRLGPVGGRIVGEVIIGLLQTDPASYLSVSPTWTPTLPKAGATFRMTDFLTFAKIDPGTRGQ